MLEEYGYPTDPLNPNGPDPEPFHKEGCWPPENPPDACPQQAGNSASYFVNENTNAIRETAWAGGVSFMLADMRFQRNCNPGGRSDVFTGLFPVGGANSYSGCNGTRHRDEGRPKTTGCIVRRHNIFYLTGYWEGAECPGYQAP